MTARVVERENVVIFLDVDNTLLDNDALKADLARRLDALVGAEIARRFWECYEAVRADEGYVDYPTTIRRFVEELDRPELEERIREVVLDYPFADRLYPHAVETVRSLRRYGLPVILSDGDPVYQPLKIQRAGLTDAVEGRVLVSVHKEAELPQAFQKYPARHYVMVDDKPGILAALETCCPSQFTTILVKQGKYARDTSYTPRPDLEVDRIGDLRDFSREQFLYSPPRSTAV